jgi:hypothetical protein
MRRKMAMKRIVFWLCVLLVAVAGVPAGADITLYEQSLDASLSGQYSNAPMDVADDFTLTTDAVVSRAKWYGFYSGDSYSPPTGNINFSVAFFSSAAGVPDDVEQWRQTLSATVTDTGFTVTDPTYHFGRRIYEFEAGFDPVSITGGTTMWLSIAENDDRTPAVGGTQWLGCYSAYPDDTHASRWPAEPWWHSHPGDMAFTLMGDAIVVPAPGAVLLGWIGFAVAGWRLKRTAA